MNNREYKLVDSNLLELVNNNIISSEQYKEANNYINKTRKKRVSITTIFMAIGILLIALSIITIFAFNWDDISKEIKTIVSFVPIIITAVMLYFCIKNEDKNMKLYTAIFAPISILATNSLISQIFHIQTEIYELLYISLFMYLPIAFIIRNHISIIIYGVGAIFYTMSAIGPYSDTWVINSILISLPLFIYNIVNYVKDKASTKNIIMWIINVIIISLILFSEEILREDVFLIYVFTIYLITQVLFKKENILNGILKFCFVAYLIISCIDSNLVSFASEVEYGFDTLIVTLAMAAFIFLSRAYKRPQEYFIFVFIALMQYTKMPTDTLFIFVNIIALALGVYTIIMGNKENSYNKIMKGVSLILLIILFRFMNSDFGFLEKSTMFLITGLIFIISSNVMKKRIGGKKDE